MPPAERLEAEILAMVAARGADKTICPSEVARALLGADETRWRLAMKPIRRVAVRLAQEGRVVLRRKGRIVDPADFKGIYRIGPPADEAGAGKSASVRPDSR
ncbi:hypothetical protein GCM10011390_05460 [Aureimonas endophytica]|uniref:DUF3253 domain-containing protein n=1 Tax=Aureimonas endophytica TaxID=2027858 RepID=A0A917E036_9HYPH|nr:DUF3253 domain-containing protein [Aureimonas endophytica]GGD89588.1 hypothetical protein GCM10011390_05460 [Aureimonas endophytica]